jgi:1-acyl-sn-glycerol-3-phosphate acyltransferase
MRSVIAPFRTLITLVSGLVSTLIWAPVVIVLARIRPTSPVIDRIARLWSMSWLVPAGSPLEVRGRQHVDRSRSYVVVANHLSILDIMACFAAIPIPIRFLAKKELFKIPLLATAMRAIGIVEVDRQARSAVHETVNRQAKELVASGRSLIIYPEGTRSRDGTLRSFKKGAFTMAVAGQIPVLPVTLHGTYQAWRPDRPWIYGGKITVVIDPPIPTEGMGREDVRRLAEQSRAVIASRLSEFDIERQRASAFD